MSEQPEQWMEEAGFGPWDVDDCDQEAQHCDCGAEVDGCDFDECSQCGWQGCSKCLHDGGDDLYPLLCDDCDPEPDSAEGQG